VDPYNFDELDPAKCGALDSSLWELHVNFNSLSSTSLSSPRFDNISRIGWK